MLDLGLDWLGWLIGRLHSVPGEKVTTNLIPLKVKLDLLGATLRDLPYWQPLATWRAHNVRQRGFTNCNLTSTSAGFPSRVFGF